MRGFGVPVALMAALSPAAQAEVTGSEVAYRAGDTDLKGYLAFDEALKGRRPGILVVPEWWGLTDYARRRAPMLAQMGYTALAVDMYGEGRTTDDPGEAASLAGTLRTDLPLATKRFQAALDRLKVHPTVDRTRVAAIGYCFGGGIVLEMARCGADLAGVVSFHASLAGNHPAAPGSIRARILVLNGEDDPMVPPEQIVRFEQEMKAAGADYRIVNYPGARHAFTNPEADEYARRFRLPVAYNVEADRKSWLEMKDFLERIFR